MRTSLLGGHRRGPRIPGHPLDGRRRGAARDGNHHPSIAPYGLFRTADGTVQIACGSESLWQALAGLLGIDDPRFATNRDRVGPRSELVAAIEGTLADEPAEDWLARLAALGVPAGKVRTLDEVYTWDQTLSQGLLIDVEHPTAGTV